LTDAAFLSNTAVMKTSVVICSHNPRPHYLPRVLGALKIQTLPKEDWELILVDNASSEALEGRFDLSWHPNHHHVVEPRLGLSWARRCGMERAAAELIVFVDDDNVLDHDYLSAAVEIGAKWPKLGTFGSAHIAPEFELEPSAYVEKILPCLALRNLNEARWSSHPDWHAMPWGAGLCLRRSVANAYLGLDSKILISDRQGSLLLSGGDVELSYMACSLGMGMGVFPELKIAHLIPRERVAKTYLLRIVEGTAVSNALIAYKWRSVYPASPFTLRGALSVVKNLALLHGIEREDYLAKLRATVKARAMIREIEAPEKLRGAC
jgi:glycosyltransferase involved in cell wall biosynthesis